jgi:hypothetical protein
MGDIPSACGKTMTIEPCKCPLPPGRPLDIDALREAAKKVKEIEDGLKPVPTAYPLEEPDEGIHSGRLCDLHDMNGTKCDGLKRCPKPVPMESDAKCGRHCKCGMGKQIHEQIPCTCPAPVQPLEGEWQWDWLNERGLILKRPDGEASHEDVYAFLAAARLRFAQEAIEAVEKRAGIHATKKGESRHDDTICRHEVNGMKLAIEAIQQIK